MTWARSQKPKKGKTVHAKADKDLSEEKEEVTSSSAPSWGALLEEVDSVTQSKTDARNTIVEKPLKKHAGQTLGFVIDTDRQYLDWAIGTVRSSAREPNPPARHSRAASLTASHRLCLRRVCTWATTKACHCPCDLGHHLGEVQQDLGREDPCRARAPPPDADRALS